jgi:predicted SAM-dependent methyltransferase
VRETVKQTLGRVLPRSLWERMLAVRRRVYWWNATRIRPGRTSRIVRELIASGRPIKLELGGGPRAGMEEWVSLNIAAGATIQHDLTRPLPFPDGSVDEIYSSHVLEHFAYPRPLLDVLEESRRVLKPGGRFSIAVPNARRYLQAYFEPDGFDRGIFCAHDVGLSYRNRIDVVNFIAYLGGEHKFMFDEENLPRVLEEGGFREVRLRAFDAAIDVPERAYDSIYAEGVK